MATVNTKITYQNKGFNAAQVLATKHIVIQDQVNANKNDNLPHNAMTISNLSTTATLFIFLDDFSDQDNPDYTLFPTQQMSLNLEDGVSFETVFIKNTHAADAVAAKSIKYNITTVKELN